MGSCPFQPWSVAFVSASDLFVCFTRIPSSPRPAEQHLEWEGGTLWGGQMGNYLNLYYVPIHLLPCQVHSPPANVSVLAPSPKYSSAYPLANMGADAGKAFEWIARKAFAEEMNQEQADVGALMSGAFIWGWDGGVRPLPSGNDTHHP